MKTTITIQFTVIDMLNTLTRIQEIAELRRTNNDPIREDSKAWQTIKALVLKHNGVFVAGVGPTKNLAFAKARSRAHDPTAKKIAYVFSGY